MITRRKFIEIAGITSLGSIPIIGGIKNVFANGKDFSRNQPSLIFSYFRAVDLLDLQVACYNILQSKANNLLIAGANAYIEIRIPQQHIAEQTFTDDEFATFKNDKKQQFATSYLSGFSHLIFTVKQDDGLDLLRELRNWHSSSKLQLVGVDSASKNYNIPANGEGYNIHAITKADHIDLLPKTTIEAPIGVFLSPYKEDQNDKLLFRYSNNLIDANLDKTANFLIEAEIKALGLKRERVLPPIDKHVSSIESSRAIELWSSDIVVAPSVKRPPSTKTDTARTKLDNTFAHPPKFKLIGTALGSMAFNDNSLVPNGFDKDDLSRQFNKSKDEIIEIYSPFFKVTGLGLYTKLQYTASDKDFLVQKWREEMVLGRDQYIEIQRIGNHYPLGHSVAEITIGTRITDPITGLSYIKREKHFKPIAPEITYRIPDDQGGDRMVPEQLAGSVLVPDDDPVKNKINSLKRSIPFQKIIITTTISPPTNDVAKDLYDILVSGNKNDYQNLIEQISDACNKYIKANTDKLNSFFSSLKAKSDAITDTNDPKRYWPGIENWIKQIISANGIDQTQLSKILTDISSTNVIYFLNYQRYISDFDSFIGKLESSEYKWARDAFVSTFLQDFKEQSDNLKVALNKIVGDINNLYQRTITYTSKNFRDAFAKIANKANIDINNYCSRIDRIKNQQDARGQFTIITEEFFGRCRSILNTDITDFENELANFRAQTNKISAIANQALNNPTEAILSYWPQLKDEQKEVYFDYIGIDWDGNEVKFKAPLMFVKQEAVNQTNKLLEKANNNLAKVNLKIEEAEQYLKDNASDIVNNIKDKIAKAASVASLNDIFTKLKTYQYVQNTYDELQQIDRQISESYQRISNQALRQIKVYEQQVAYYKQLGQKVGEAIKQQVTSWKTNFIEFSASGMAEVCILRYTLKNTIDKSLAHFEGEFRNAFTQLQVFEAVQLPVVGEIAKFNKGVLLKYGEAYKNAGVELLSNNPALKKGYYNAEKVLFEIRNASYKYIGKLNKDLEISKKDLDDKIQQVTKLINKGIVSDIKTGAIDLAKSYNTTLDNWFADKSSYVDGKINGIFDDAGQMLAGTVVPATVIDCVSLYDNSYAVAKAELDKFTGRVTKQMIDDTSTVQKYTKEAGNKLKEILSEIKLFGIEIVNYLKEDANVLLDQMPKPNIKDIKNTVNELLAREVSYEWNLKIADVFETNKGGLLRSGISSANNNPPATLTCTLTIQTSIDKGKLAVVSSDISIKNFGIAIPIGGKDVIGVYFYSVDFKKINTAQFGEVKTTSNVNVQIATVEFGYLLELIKMLEELLGIKNGFVPRITNNAISLDFGFALPTISTGAFTITNAAVFAGVTLPFSSNDQPTVTFSFSERSKPFTLAAGIYGGRGFVGLAANSQGLQRFEASLEFGGYLALDLGIAQGQAYLMAGIYLRLQKNSSPYIEGYIVCGGSLNILGIIQVTVTFYLGMGYQNGALVGRASVTVSISLLFFSASYTLTFEKRITGSSVNAYVPERLNQNEWAYNITHGGPNIDKDGEYYEEGDNDPLVLNAHYYLKNNTKESKMAAVNDPAILFSHDIDEKDANDYVSIFSL